jgi:hypothetical protein
MTYEEVDVGQRVRIKVGKRPATGVVKLKVRQRYGTSEQERVWVHTEDPKGVRICSPVVLEPVAG